MSETAQEVVKSDTSASKEDAPNETEKAAGEENDGGEKGSQHSGAEENDRGSEAGNGLSADALSLKDELDKIQVEAPTVEMFVYSL